MSVQPIPTGYHTITPYLIANDAAKLVEFLKAAFGAEVKTMNHGPDGLIVHSTLQVGDSMLMLSNARGPWQPQPAGFYLYVPNVDELYDRAISAGAESITTPRTEFYGDRMAGVKDANGNTWWIATHVEDVNEEELHSRQEKLFAPKAKT